MGISHDWQPNEGSRLLFFDNDDVQELHNVEIRVCPAQKHSRNPLLPLGDLDQWDSAQAVPWAGRTVLFDAEDGLFKTWYAGTDAGPERWWKTGYAVSRDGLVWEKPPLGLIEFNGSRDNNICADYFGPVIKDLAEPDPKRRFKMFVKKPPGKPDQMGIDTSPDGIHWGSFIYLDLDPWSGKKGDSVLFLRDEQEPDPNRRYKMIWQNQIKANKPGPETVRAKSLAYGPSESQWQVSPHNPILSPNGGLEQENHFLMYIPYRGRTVLLYEYGWYLPDGYGNFGTYAADIRLAHSRDGERFERVRPDQKVIPRGPHGAWDDQFMVISDKAIMRGGKIYLYYSGLGEAWTSWPAENNPSTKRFPSSGSIRLSRMGLATLELDRFTCLATRDGETPGSAVAGPAPGSDLSRLRLNVSGTQQRRSWVEVEVLKGNEVIAGFERARCLPVQSDGQEVPVVWKDQPKSPGGDIRLRFWIIGDARLHAVHM